MHAYALNACRHTQVRMNTQTHTRRRAHTLQHTSAHTRGHARASAMHTKQGHTAKSLFARAGPSERSLSVSFITHTHRQTEPVQSALVERACGSASHMTGSLRASKAVKRTKKKPRRQRETVRVESAEMEKNGEPKTTKNASIRDAHIESTAAKERQKYESIVPNLEKMSSKCSSVGLQ